MSGKHLIAAAGLLAIAGILAILATLPGTSVTVRSTSGDAISGSERARMHAIVRDYLRENPAIIVEAIETLQARTAATERDRMRKAIAANRNALIANASDPAIGPESASVTIVEFFDYQCPYCKRMTGSIMALSAMDPDLRIVFKEFPILSAESEIAARAGLAADRQGKYKEFHVALMQTGGKPSMAAIEAAAKVSGVDMAQLRADMADPEIAAVIAENLRLAREIGINGTPAFIVGDEMIPGAVDPARLVEIVARLRAKAN
ncbi:MAG: DsbA family protein [Alphaproteobacteria bacterium]